MTKKILFVAMQMSIHTARWINQLVDEAWDVHLFPVNHLALHPELRNITVHQPLTIIRPKFVLKKWIEQPSLIFRGFDSIESLYHQEKEIKIQSLFPIPVLTHMMAALNRLKKTSTSAAETFVPAIYGPTVLKHLIKKLKPDLIHSLELQTCGYTVLRTKELHGPGFPTWLATNWGSDIYYYRQFPAHRQHITQLLQNIDYYSCECHRDVGLAQELGLKKQAIKVMPNTGGFNLSEIESLRSTHRPSERRLVMIKGYQHFVGRALTALDALERCHKALKEYSVIVFSASADVKERVNELKQCFGINISILNHTSHQQMLKMFSRTRIYLGVSLSDAISTSMLEAIALGAFPIQTNTACCDEWITDGETGFAIPPHDVPFIADRLLRALKDDTLVDNAAEKNWQVTCERLDARVLKQEAIAMYQEIFAEIDD